MSAVAGNQYFDQKALQNIQTEELQEAFNEWTENDFMSAQSEGSTEKPSDKEELLTSKECINEDKEGEELIFENFKKEQDKQIRQEFKEWLKLESEKDKLKNKIIKEQEIQIEQEKLTYERNSFLKKLNLIMVLRKQIDRLKMEQAILKSNTNNFSKVRVADITKEIDAIEGKIKKIKGEGAIDATPSISETKDSIVIY